MNGSEQSDEIVVPTKTPNKTGSPVAEALEGRISTKGNTGKQTTYRTQRRGDVPHAL